MPALIRRGKPPALPGDSASSTVTGTGSDVETNGVFFPLTPTLSLGEREKPRRRWDRAVRVGLARRWLTRLPLPKGEGWGEGESDVPTPGRAACRPRAEGSPEGLYGFEPFTVSSLQLCRRSLISKRLYAFWVHGPNARAEAGGGSHEPTV